MECLPENVNPIASLLRSKNFHVQIDTSEIDMDMDMDMQEFTGNIMIFGVQL